MSGRPPASRIPPLPLRWSAHAPHQRVRRAMYLAFALLAALAIFQAGYAHRFERVRAADAEIISLAGTQRAFTQQMGRMAALAGGDAEVTRVHADLLAEALDRSRADALLVEALLDAQLKLADQRDPALADALMRWQAARERLWYRCEALLRHLDDGRVEALAGAAQAVQIETEPSLDAANALTVELQRAARVRSERQVQLLEGGVALTLLVLVGLALWVVEPMVRAVRSQVSRVAEQSRELSRLALVASRTDNLVIVTDPERRIEWVNEAFTRLTGYALEQARGLQPARLLYSDANDEATVRRLRQALDAGIGVRDELILRARDGREFWVDADIQPLHDDRGVLRGFVTLAADITERRRLQEQLRHSARTDALTGLPNRAVVLDRLQRAIHHARRHPGYGFAVLFMDFDRFKQVNDTLGHPAGDALLQQIARRIEDSLRPGDAIARVASELQTAARIGGDEFVVVLEGLRSDDEALHVAQRLLAELAEPYLLGTQSVESGASIGIVTSNHAADSAEEVLRDADTAMYEAKRAGRGRCVVFNPSMHDRVVRALEIENDLRRALRDGELFVVYQPVVELDTRALAGVEALVRWRHPTRGLVPPHHFIGVAEEAGLIDAIGQEVLQSACRDFARWRRELGDQAPRQLAVNLSRAQLQLPGLVPEVRWVLEQNGLAPADLQCEVTESLAAQDERVQVTLRELKALGVRLSLDDFGTGYSSLACLHQLPVDTVKIDRSFVSHAETVEYHRVLIEATIRVAQALGMSTVAEGIETEAQARLMQQLHCGRGQGYLFSAPMTAEELERWICAAARRPVPAVA
jgi:diguanylate cyclase (GGDEF)-like protein/PAS domain S-box-containing protein